MPLTWNCQHIANAQIPGKLAEISLDLGYELPILCTPYELQRRVIMLHDEIVEEIHRIREEYSGSFNHDLKAIFADLQKQQAQSGREVVRLSPKRSLAKRWSGRARD